jgi:hypothetical protein
MTMAMEHRQSSPYREIWADETKSRVYVKALSTPTPMAAQLSQQDVAHELDRIHLLRPGTIDMIFEFDNSTTAMSEETLQEFLHGAAEIFTERSYVRAWLVTNYQSFLWMQVMKYIPQLRSVVKGVFTDMEDAADAIDKIRGFSELSTSHTACLEALEHLSARTTLETASA